MKLSRREFSLLAASATGASMLPSSVWASSTDGLEVNDDGLHTQDWFLESFLDLTEDLEVAAENGKNLAVLFEQRGCPYCKEMHKVNFARPEILEYVKPNFDILQINLWGSRGVTDFNGEEMEERALASKWLVNFTPTMIFFPKTLPSSETATGRDHEVMRMPGYFKPFHFLSMFQYVKEEAYKSQNFQRYLQDKFKDMQAKGIDPEVW